MNNIKTFFAIPLILAATLFFACDNGDPESKGAAKYDLTVTVDLGDIVLPEGTTPSYLVEVENTANDKSYNKTSTEKEVVFADLEEGVYKVTVSSKVNSSLSVIGTRNVQHYSDQNVTVKVEASVTQDGGLIFKEIYTAANGIYFLDKYVEIVNNSDEVQYLNQVILGYQLILYAPNPWVDGGGDLLDTFPMFGYCVYFPGNGTDYPLQPGASVVVANNAADHSILNDTPGSPDLSKADWEIYLSDDKIETSQRTDIDYDAPNMEVLLVGNAQSHWGPGAFGGTMILAKLPEGVHPEDYVADGNNRSTIPNQTTSTHEYLLIPSDYIIDGVHLFDMTETENYATLKPKTDAGYTYFDAFEPKSVRRKVTMVVDGRAYYQDTNNSTEDFIPNAPLTPGVHPTTVD